MRALAADLPARAWPLQDRQIRLKHLVWRSQTQTSHDIVIGFSSVHSQLSAAVCQAVHPHPAVKARSVGAVLALHLAVVPGVAIRIRLYAMPISSKASSNSVFCVRVTTSSASDSMQRYINDWKARQ